MKLSELKNLIPEKVYTKLESRGFAALRPSQVKSIKAGLFEDKNILVCTPTASGKTLVGELAFLNAIYHDHGKAVYIVPLKALASEKYKEFKKHYPEIKTAISFGDKDSSDDYLEKYDLIITTSEKLDSLVRHRANWIKEVKTIIVDEIHLLNDPSRGPGLEVLITILRTLIKNLQVIGLSATIGNPKELAGWLSAELVEDEWRPVRLDKGVYMGGEIEFD
jgi:helicase